MKEYIDRIFFAAEGHVLDATYYYRLVRRDDNKVWTWNTPSLELAEDVEWSNSIIMMPEAGETGQYPVRIPENVPGGSYYVTIYKVEGSSPSNTDSVQDSYLTKIGDIFGF